MKRVEVRPEAAIRADMRETSDEINRQFWIFTRTARGSPVDPALTRRQVALEDELNWSRYYQR